MVKKGESFEELFSALEERARKLEQGNLGLEASLALYEEGAEIAARLRELLEGAELRIEKVRAKVETERSGFRELEVAYGEEDE